MSSFSVAQLDPAQADTSLWPQVDEAAIPTAKGRALFLRRSRAVKAVLRDIDAVTVLDEAGLSRTEVIRLIKRCLSVHPDGRLYGFRALIPQKRLVPYMRHSTRRLDPAHPGGAVGVFGQLMRTYPDLAALVEAHVFKLGQRQHIRESRIPIKSLHKRFIDKCRELGLEKAGLYPFNTRTLGYVALAAHVRHLLEDPARAMGGALGDDVAKQLRRGDGTARPLVLPFDRVECDAHHIDAIFCILIPSLFGEAIPKVVPRLWVIVLQEVCSKAILGYHLSLREECDADDVLLAVRHALSAWTPRTLSVPGMAYGPESGFPSSYDARFIGACWNEFSIDGAMANLSHRVADKLDRVVGAKPIVLPRRIPDDRPFIERFFQALEAGGFHRLPNTTGSGPADPRRHHPEQAAVRYTLQVEHLEELLDVLIANFNATPHSSIGYRTPLAYLLYLCEAHQRWPRQADPTEVSRLLNLFRTVRVQGGTNEGRRPYIHYLGVRYSSEVLTFATHWVGQKISIEVDVHDLRSLRAYAPDGAEIGVLRAAPPWHRTPHTREMRQAINSLVRRKMLDYLNQHDPVMALLEYLETLARKGRAVPPLYLAVRRRLAAPLEERGTAADGPPPTGAQESRTPPSTLPPPRKTLNG